MKQDDAMVVRLSHASQPQNDARNLLRVHLAQHGTATPVVHVDMKATFVAIQNTLHCDADRLTIDASTGAKIVDVSVIRYRLIASQQYQRRVWTRGTETAVGKSDSFRSKGMRTRQIMPN